MRNNINELILRPLRQERTTLREARKITIHRIHRESIVYGDQSTVAIMSQKFQQRKK